MIEEIVGVPEHIPQIGDEGAQLICSHRMGLEATRFDDRLDMPSLGAPGRVLRHR
jgi:hypothetical protein